MVLHFDELDDADSTGHRIVVSFFHQTRACELVTQRLRSSTTGVCYILRDEYIFNALKAIGSTHEPLRATDDTDVGGKRSHSWRGLETCS